MLRVLIVDDEKLARERIADLLARERDVEVVGTASNGGGAIAEIRDLDPDLVFLDVQMPGKTGLDVVRELGADGMPPTIFVTAYDQYAIKAFELAAIDYLLKPFDDERFEQAFRRARRAIELEQVDRLSTQLRAVLQGAATVSGPASRNAPQYLDRIPVEGKGQVRVVPVTDIDYISAEGPYVEIHAGTASYHVRERMQALEQKLDPQQFLRIHRSTIVRLDLIDKLLRAGGGDYSVKLKNGVELNVSRTRIEELERRLGL
ncbi:MAG TPA: LytTR family DNA-binding domain-containing protein [Longimicrobiales bacterium]|nr:LytTR family DNA-binding domain-containing protein [Longimicrobiales bacterium]